MVSLVVDLYYAIMMSYAMNTINRVENKIGQVKQKILNGVNVELVLAFGVVVR
jgi:hypothetical protein